MPKKKIDGKNREELFCYYVAQIFNVQEAAIKAGFPPDSADADAVKLLSKKSVRHKIATLRKENRNVRIKDAVIQGLLRLAFGTANDAIVLTFDEEQVNDIRTLDLFALAEMRRPKGGGWELRFINRLDAFRLLLECAKGQDQRGESSLYQAIEAAAKAVSEEQSNV